MAILKGEYEEFATFVSLTIDAVRVIGSFF